MNSTPDNRLVTVTTMTSKSEGDRSGHGGHGGHSDRDIVTAPERPMTLPHQKQRWGASSKE